MMRSPFANFDLPAEKKPLMCRAQWLEWASLFFLVTIIVVIGLTMGSSQAMKTMWIEDLLSLVPSTGFLIGAYFRGKPPDEQFPYGYRRAVLVCYLAGAMALFFLGLYMFGDAIYKLVTAEHPTIQTISLFGRRVWLGWLMIAALVYSVIPPFVLGRLKTPLARELNDKALYTSAMLNRGDWLAGLAGVAGILGIAWGYWWADSVAASLISCEIIKDGFSSLRNSIAQLMNKRPSDVASKEDDPVVDKVQQKLESLGWVARARVRLREDGDALTGEAYVVPRDAALLLDKLDEATDAAHSVDWRLHNVNVVPVRSLE